MNISSPTLKPIPQPAVTEASPKSGLSISNLSFPSFPQVAKVNDTSFKRKIMTVFRRGIFDESHETSSCKNLGFVKFSRINTKNHPFCVNHEIQALSSRRFFSYKRTGVKVNLSVETENLFNVD